MPILHTTFYAPIVPTHRALAQVEQTPASEILQPLSNPFTPPIRNTSQPMPRTSKMSSPEPHDPGIPDEHGLAHATVQNTYFTRVDTLQPVLCNRPHLAQRFDGVLKPWRARIIPHSPAFVHQRRVGRAGTDGVLQLEPSLLPAYSPSCCAMCAHFWSTNPVPLRCGGRGEMYSGDQARIANPWPCGSKSSWDACSTEACHLCCWALGRGGFLATYKNQPVLLLRCLL